MATHDPRRKRILISAYACEPDRGSEPEVGLQAMLTAAEHHDVVLITRANNIEALEAFLATHPLRGNIQLLGIDLSRRAQRFKKRLGRLSFYWYYDRWQRLAGRTAERLHRETPFAMAHHVTLATYWQRAGVWRLGVPFVLGPVGGGVTTPLTLLSELGPVGIATDAVRILIQRLWELRPSVRASMAHADVVLAQNPETSRRIRTEGRVVVAPNGLSAAITEWDGAAERTRDVVVVGRMIPYKGGALAVRAFEQVNAPDARLVFIGDGPERSRLEALVEDSGLSERVVFAGRIPRSEVLERIGSAACLFHPALHDDSPLTVAEALSLGTPVVCLDRGGPPVICSMWPSVESHVVPVGPKSTVVSGLARAIERSLASAQAPPGRPCPPERTFGQQILTAYREALSEG